MRRVNPRKALRGRIHTSPKSAGNYAKVSLALLTLACSRTYGLLLCEITRGSQYYYDSIVFELKCPAGACILASMSHNCRRARQGSTNGERAEDCPRAHIACEACTVGKSSCCRAEEQETNNATYPALPSTSGWITVFAIVLAVRKNATSRGLGLPIRNLGKKSRAQ